MTKYLLRRRNRFGQYVHLETYPFDPYDLKIKKDFGPGQYSILIAEEGVRGLSKLRDVYLPWDIRYLEEIEGQPTLEYITRKYGVGNYFSLESCRVKPYQVYPTEQMPVATWNFLQDGANAMRNISVIYEVQNLPWLE